LKHRTSSPPNQCVGTCPGTDLPDSGDASSHQYVCREKCDKTTTYKFRTTVSGKPVCHTECTTKHFYETADGEYVCLDNGHCNQTPIPNARLGTSYSDFKYRHKFGTTDHFQCKADCTYAFVQHGTSPVHKTCVSKCSNSTINSYDTAKIKVDDSLSESGKKECVTACSDSANEYLFNNSQGDRQCTSTCPPPTSDANYDNASGAANTSNQAFVSHDGNRFCITKTGDYSTCPLYIKSPSTIRQCISETTCQAVTTNYRFKETETFAVNGSNVTYSYCALQCNSTRVVHRISSDNECNNSCNTTFPNGFTFVFNAITHSGCVATCPPDSSDFYFP